MKQMMEINADVSKAKTMSIVIIHWSTVICHWENRSAIVASLKWPVAEVIDRRLYSSREIRSLLGTITGGHRPPLQSSV